MIVQARVIDSNNIWTGECVWKDESELLVNEIAVYNVDNQTGYVKHK